jgi:VWFA-related protein
MSKHKRVLTLVSIVSLLLFLSASVILNSSVPQEPMKQPTLQYEVSVTLKLIQAFVTDRQGNPVTDLKKTDFEVYDNGILKTVTDFERHVLALARPKTEQSEQAPPQKPEASYAGQISKLNRKFFFVFDIEKNDLQGLAQSKKAALHFMETQVQPTDEIGILSYQARRGLVIHEYLSTDHKRVRRAIEKLRGVPGTGSGGLPTEPGLEERTSILASEEGPSILAYLAPPPNPEAEELAMLRRNFVQIMAEFAKALRYIPGYKNIILFSAGLSRSVLTRDSGLRKDYEDMSKEFGSSSSPVYSVNALGTRSNIVSPGDRGDVSLKDLSTLSGGRYFEDVAQADKIMVGIQNATSNYYVLGYYIDEKWDGEFHGIDVKVKREGCVVSTQNGYYNPKPFSRFSDFEKQLHLIDLGFNENPQFQRPTELPLTALPCLDESGSYLVLVTELPWESLKEIMQPPTEVVTFVFDQNNNVINSKGGYVQVPDFSKRRVVYYDIISLKPAAYHCAVILRNMKTGKAARARGEAIIPQPHTSGLQLDLPLLLIPTVDKNVAYFSLTKRAEGASEKPLISLKDFFPFLTDRLVPVMDEVAKGTSKVFAIIRSTVKNIPNADIRIYASLKHGAAGEEIPLFPSILKTNRVGEVDIILLELPFPELTPGDYILILVAKDEKSGEKAEASRGLKFS